MDERITIDLALQCRVALELDRHAIRAIFEQLQRIFLARFRRIRLIESVGLEDPDQELLDRIASLEESLNKSTHSM